MEEKKNIFSGAVFGDRFKTRSGRMATYVGEEHYNEENIHHYLILEGEKVAYHYLESGVFYYGYYDENLDIISRIDDLYRCGYESGLECSNQAAYLECIDKTVAWFKSKWSSYIGVDRDGIPCFGHWENDYRKDMQDLESESCVS